MLANSTTRQFRTDRTLERFYNRCSGLSSKTRGPGPPRTEYVRATRANSLFGGLFFGVEENDFCPRWQRPAEVASLEHTTSRSAYVRQHPMCPRCVLSGTHCEPEERALGEPVCDLARWSITAVGHRESWRGPPLNSPPLDRNYACGAFVELRKLRRCEGEEDEEQAATTC